MILNEASDVKLGDKQVESIFLGDTLIWERTSKFVTVSTDTVWLIDENDMEVVDVTSNTEWTVK